MFLNLYVCSIAISRVNILNRYLFMVKLFQLVFFTIFSITSFSQYTWKLSKEKDGIKVYQSPVQNSNYKSIKVDCVLEGTYDKLIKVLNDVSHFKDWVYNNKEGYVLKQIGPEDYYYYTETYLPWPMANRDAIEHLKITRDSLDRFLKITAQSESDYVPEKNGKVRVPHSAINWYVTSTEKNKIRIEYIFQAEPGGNIPAWIVNMFADKGPIESFKKLADILKK